MHVRAAVLALRLLLVSLVVLVGSGCAQVSDAPPAHELESRIPIEALGTSVEPLAPIPIAMDHLDPRRVELGRRLFEDPLLSGDGTRSCVTCHVLEEGGIVPGEARSNHPMNATGPYNVPTVFNVAFNFRFNWQGKFQTLEEHLTGPMMNREVMNAGSWESLVGRLRPAYTAVFVRAGYPDGVTEHNVKDAIASYQRSLTTPNARFDRYLRGEIRLTADELAGYELFKRIGCVTCHQGINVGGNLFQRFGVMEDAFGGRPLNDRDLGRYLVTRRDSDMHVFRVPSLRNVAVTAPYFHDGSAHTLEDAITHMARVQLAYMLTPEEVAQIAAFLRSLTGEYQGRSLAEGAAP